MSTTLSVSIFNDSSSNVLSYDLPFVYVTLKDFKAVCLYFQLVVPGTYYER